MRASVEHGPDAVARTTALGRENVAILEAASVRSLIDPPVNIDLQISPLQTLFPSLLLGLINARATRRAGHPHALPHGHAPPTTLEEAIVARALAHSGAIKHACHGPNTSPPSESPVCLIPLVNQSATPRPRRIIITSSSAQTPLSGSATPRLITQIQSSAAASTASLQVCLRNPDCGARIRSLLESVRMRNTRRARCGVRAAGPAFLPSSGGYSPFASRRRRANHRRDRARAAPQKRQRRSCVPYTRPCTSSTSRITSEAASLRHEAERIRLWSRTRPPYGIRDLMHLSLRPRTA